MELRSVCMMPWLVPADVLLVPVIMHEQTASSPDDTLRQMNVRHDSAVSALMFLQRRQGKSHDSNTYFSVVKDRSAEMRHVAVTITKGVQSIEKCAIAGAREIAPLGKYYRIATLAIAVGTFENYRRSSDVLAGAAHHIVSQLDTPELGETFKTIVFASSDIRVTMAFTSAIALR